MYPIKVQEIACEVSKQFFPSEPITYVSAGSMSSDFDGMMIPVPQKKPKPLATDARTQMIADKIEGMISMSIMMHNLVANTSCNFSPRDEFKRIKTELVGLLKGLTLDEKEGKK